jgi:hypothetical protein
MASMLTDPRDPTVGTFGMSLYLSSGKEAAYPMKTLSGTYTTVPSGYVFRAYWDNSSREYTFLNVHPRERTLFPSLNTKLACGLTGQLETRPERE